MNKSMCIPVTGKHSGDCRPIFWIYVGNDVEYGVVDYTIPSTQKCFQASMIRPNVTMPENGAVFRYGIKAYAFGRKPVRGRSSCSSV